jgi:hypothetical protein
LFEDSVTESFSGIYETYLLPNNDYDINVRLEQLQSAIKLIYASVFSKISRSYFDAINYKIEEEKMAIVIQEVIGVKHGTKYYPHISGVAQSYNYYPVSYMKPKDGIVIMGTGLGKYIIDGENSFRYCPKYPNLEMNTPEEVIKGSQNFIYALNMGNTRYDLINGDDVTYAKVSLQEAEKQGMLDNIVSVWDEENERFQTGLLGNGPRIVNFSKILKYNHCKLPHALVLILDVLQDFMGMPVEIEFAVKFHDMKKNNLDKIYSNGNHNHNLSAGQYKKKASLYILQVKPLIRKDEDYNIDETKIEMNKLLLYTHKGMGNGKLEDIYDLIYCDPACFDKSKTVEMAEEIESINNKFKAEGKKYILIGPGRWGTRDRWLGIPVVWTQISNAKIIVETALDDFFVDASLGSHFFHNITSMNIGYFTVHTNREDEFIDWNWLKNIEPFERTKYFCRCTFRHPLKVLMDGKKSISLIYKT